MRKIYLVMPYRPTTENYFSELNIRLLRFLVGICCDSSLFVYPGVVPVAFPWSLTAYRPKNTPYTPSIQDLPARTPSSTLPAGTTPEVHHECLRRCCWVEPPNSNRIVQRRCLDGVLLTFLLIRPSGLLNAAKTKGGGVGLVKPEDRQCCVGRLAKHCRKQLKTRYSTEHLKNESA